MSEKELPIGWVKATLNDVAEYINGMAFKPADWEETGKPIIRIQNLTNPHKHYNYTTKDVAEKYRVYYDDHEYQWKSWRCIA